MKALGDVSPRLTALLGVRAAIAGMCWLVVAAVCGLLVRGWLGAGVLYPWKIVAWMAATVAVVIVGVRSHPFPRLGPANQATLIRSMLLAMVGSLIGEPETMRVAGAAVTASSVILMLDGLDGWLARRYRMVSAFGARFDMETDAVLVMVLSVLVWRHEKAGAWVLLGGALRYAFVAAGWVSPWMGRPLGSTFRGKVAAVCHLLGLTVALAPFVPPRFSTIAVAATLTLLVWSFVVDVRRLWRREFRAFGEGKE